MLYPLSYGGFTRHGLSTAPEHGERVYPLDRITLERLDCKQRDEGRAVVNSSSTASASWLT
ncbi:MAG: hypothetical protein WBB62_06870 [Rhodococcus sp. (in: high G+C Gram-positive bacteria)]